LSAAPDPSLLAIFSRALSAGDLPVWLSTAYNSVMIRAYEEIVDFIAAGTTPQAVAHFEPSQETKDRVADLIHREKTAGLAPEETSELDYYLRVEHLMRLAKARAWSYCADD